ncbi:BTB/POZ domain-containing protein 2-like [Montipora capricornis]|uniref:BTB/POZ domain-containing protein 2-like n=1 Tax=Montipora capricornis TaxID=246305 RepID=UPI0035F1FC91
MQSTMASVEENWQTKNSSISQRTKFVFNKEILSDVKFIVPVSNDKSEIESKVIPAHKFVLAISSPVFYAMFYGPRADSRYAIELPNCEYESVLEFFRFLYSDEVQITGSNVMRVLYLAKKYLVPSLADKCSKFLGDNLGPSNVFSILPHAEKFEDKELENRCWEVIELNAAEAVTSNDFVTVEGSQLKSVVKRDRLNIKEVELFKAVDRWAKDKCEKQGLAADGQAKRRIIGEEILKEKRFSLMSQMEFASFVIDSNILNVQEVGDMMKHYSKVLTSPLPFAQSSRLVVEKRCRRFTHFKQPGTNHDGPWSYVRGPDSGTDCLCLRVDKAINLLGVQHFGCKGGEYTVSTEVTDVTRGSSQVKASGTYSCEKDMDHAYYGFKVLFNSPVILEPGKIYKIISNIKGPQSWYGEQGKVFFETAGVGFTISKSDQPNNGTNETTGQFPGFLFHYFG